MATRSAPLCRLCGHQHFFEDEGDTLPWGSCRACDCPSPAYGRLDGTLLSDGPPPPPEAPTDPLNLHDQDAQARLTALERQYAALEAAYTRLTRRAALGLSQPPAARRSGRTSRMLQAAIQQAQHTPVVVLAASARHVTVLTQQLNALSPRTHLPVRIQTVPRDFWEAGYAGWWGTPVPTVFVDHYAAELRLEHLHAQRLRALAYTHAFDWGAPAPSPVQTPFPEPW